MSSGEPDPENEETWFECPECEEQIKWSDREFNQMIEDYVCPGCNFKIDHIDEEE